jgi:hypothetical protein
MYRRSFIKSSSMASFGLGFTNEKTLSYDSNISGPIVIGTCNMKRGNNQGLDYFNM